jgi:hypothetical protein
MGEHWNPIMNYRIVNSPWPEREGCCCRIVTRPQGRAGQQYPWPGLGRHEKVIRIDDDPLGAPWNGWSCVISIKCLIPWTGEPENQNDPAPGTKRDAGSNG